MSRSNQLTPGEENEIRDFFKCVRTVHEMLLDRGYNVNEEDMNKSREDFKKDFVSNGFSRQHFQIFAGHKENEDNTVFVFFPEDEKFSVDGIKECGKVVEERNISVGLIVIKDAITAFARKTLDRINQEFRIELFKQNELMINITRHKFVPKHVILTETQKRELLKKYKLIDSQLPRIQALDPVCRYFGAVKGQVFKITRPSETAGRYVTYRLVI